MIIAYFLLSACICHAVCQTPPGDLNDKWRLNDLLLEHIDGFYYDFAITSAESNDTSKRFSSIVSLAMSIYASSDIKDPRERVKRAVQKTRSMLGESADTISALMRSRLILMRSILDPPINDVKLSCPPDATQEECTTKLAKYREGNELSCNGYSKHVKLYEAVVDETTSGYRADFMNALHQARSSGGDEDAIKFFVDISTVKYPKLFQYINKVYKSLVDEPFPCNALRLPTYYLSLVDV